MKNTLLCRLVIDVLSRITSDNCRDKSQLMSSVVTLRPQKPQAVAVARASELLAETANDQFARRGVAKVILGQPADPRVDLADIAAVGQLERGLDGGIRSDVGEGLLGRQAEGYGTVL